MYPTPRVVVLFAFILCLFSFRLSAQERANQWKSLKGVEGVYVSVELGPDDVARQAGLSETQIRS